MIKEYLIIILIIYTSITKAQEYCKVPIEIDEAGTSFRLFLGNLEESTSDYIFVGDLHTCKGKLDLKIYTLDSMLLSQGSYIESLDTLKRYQTVFIEDIVLNKDDIFSEKIMVYSFFQPLKLGEWKYYDESGVVIRREE